MILQLLQGHEQKWKLFSNRAKGYGHFASLDSEFIKSRRLAVLLMNSMSIIIEATRPIAATASAMEGVLCFEVVGLDRQNLILSCLFKVMCFLLTRNCQGNGVWT